MSGEVSGARWHVTLTQWWLNADGLLGIDAFSSPMGARVALELARRRDGVFGAVVSLDPGGFWQGQQRHVFFTIQVPTCFIRVT